MAAGAISTCVVVGLAAPAHGAPPLAGAGAMGWIAGLHPGAVPVSTTLLGGDPTPALRLPDGALVTIESASPARVTPAPTEALLIAFRIHREVDGFWRDRQFGVAVVQDGRLLWSVESEPAFSFRGTPDDLVVLRRGDPPAIRLSYAFTTDPAEPRAFVRRERVFAFRDGAIRPVLDDSTPVDAHGRMIDVAYGYGAADESGWDVITRSASEPGSSRTCDFVFAQGRYQEHVCEAAATRPAIAALALAGPITVLGRELCLNPNADPNLPLLATLDTVDTVVEDPAQWPGPATCQVSLYGGWLAGSGNLLLHFRVLSAAAGGRCELWIWDGTLRREYAWAFIPGRPGGPAGAVVRLGSGTALPATGVLARFRRLPGGYSVLAEVEAGRFHLAGPEAGRYRACLLTRFAAGRGGEGACTMASSRAFRAGLPATYNPLDPPRNAPLEISKGWMAAVITSVGPGPGRLTVRDAPPDDGPDRHDGDLAMTLTPATQVRTLRGTAVPASALEPGDGAEVGYHYADGVRRVDWLRPYEKTLRGTVTDVDARTARVGFQDPAGVRHRVEVPATASKPSYDQFALADVGSIHVGDAVTVGYVGRAGAAVVERISARPGPGRTP